MPKVSVVIPTYNRAYLLSECIQSVLAQSLRDFEIIVIDDGSTDNTREIVSAFPVRYLWQENLGAPAARNKGLELAEGEYIVFLDSDDALLKDALKKGVEILDKHPEAGFSYGQAYMIDEKGDVFKVRKRRHKHPHVRDGGKEIAELIFGCHIPAPTVMVRRCCLEEVGAFNTAFASGSQDLELWVRLAKRYAAACIPEPLARYRFHTRTMSHAREPKEIEQTHGVILESIFNDPKMGPILTPKRASAYSHLYFSLAGHAYHDHHDMKTAREYLFRAMKTHPSGFFKTLGLPWVFLLAKTWVPLPILSSARNAKRYLRRATSPQIPPES